MGLIDRNPRVSLAEIDEVLISFDNTWSPLWSVLHDFTNNILHHS